MYLTRSDVLKRYNKDLFIRPLLEESQIGEITTDFRLGYDFHISSQGRNSTLNASLINNENQSIDDSFTQTRRRPGETFVLYPNQTVLAISLEYLKLPNDISLLLGLRSSYSRLGLHSSSMFQPGYVGCLSIEITNVNKIPINVTVGSRLFQGRFVSMNEKSNYFHKKRKYSCQTRPKVSALHEDSDLIFLKKYFDSLQSS
ncbi:dCTP deaminase [Ekhidna sp.]